MYANSINYTHGNILTHKHTNIPDCMRTADNRSERRIIKNRIRRQQEMKKNFLILVMTICLILACSFTISVFRSNAKNETATSYKYYKSIAVSNNDTLWSIAEQYMNNDYYDSINDYIDEVKRMNSLSGDSIHYGEYLIIPYYNNNF